MDAARPQQCGLDDAEHREVDTDAEGEDRDDGWPTRAAESANGVTKILEQLVEPPLPASRAQVLLQGFGATQFHPRTPLRFGARHAAADEIVGIRIDVEPQLVGHAILEPLSRDGDAER